MRHFSQFRGLLSYSQNTALKRICKVSFVLCFVLKLLSEKKKKKKQQKKKKKKTVGGTRNDPFGYSNTSNIFCLISKYLLLASQTNINIILQDFLYSFGWRHHWSQWKGVVFKIKSYFSKKYNLSKLVGKSCSSFICSLKTSISFPIHSIFNNVCKVALLLWFIVAKDCGFDFNVRNLNIKLLYTATLYQVKSYLHIKPIKKPSHLGWGQMRVVSKVTPFLLFFFNIESNRK